LLSTQPVTPVYPNKSGTTFTHGVTVVVPVMLEVVVPDVVVPDVVVIEVLVPVTERLVPDVVLLDVALPDVVVIEVLVAEVDVPEALVELSVIVTVDDFTQ
jgi:hypothetical protein